MKNIKINIVIVILGTGALSCSHNPPQSQNNTNFTRIDSLTDRYLLLQDSLFQSWNMMMMDENKKIKAMHNVVHELMYSGQEDKSELVELEHRLNDLSSMYLKPESLDSQDLLEEYDFAINSLVSEVISLTESHSTFSYNNTLQKLVEEIKVRDQRVEVNRDSYDHIANEFNKFITRNKSLVNEISNDTSFVQKPLFSLIEE
jgi:hypothetical protein